MEGRRAKGVDKFLRTDAEQDKQLAPDQKENGFGVNVEVFA